MKKAISIILSACLLFGSAFAAEAPQSDQLAKVTKLVKAQIDVGDQYTDFKGYQSREMGLTYWSLSWSGGGESLEVQAGEDGTIYYYWQSARNSAYRNDYAPKLPKSTRGEALAAANAFVSRVMRDKEGYAFENDNDDISIYNTDSCSFSGQMTYDGVPTPVTLRVQVSLPDLTVTSYSRNEEPRVGAIPSKTPAVTKEAAAPKLRATNELRLEYVLEEGETQAVLRYVPQAVNDFYVDAQTGALVDLDQLYEKARDKGYGGASAGSSADAAAENGLSAYEQDAIAALEGVLGTDALDAKLRAMPELGLSGYKLSGTQYSQVDDETGAVMCSLQYVKAGTDSALFKSAEVDARTGALQYLSTHGGEEIKSPATTYAGDAGDAKAAAFLKRYFTEQSEQSALYDMLDFSNRYVRYTYAEQVNGHPYPGNAFTVGINRQSGLVDSFYYTWNDAVTFDSADGLITAEQALDAYFGAQTVTLQYVAVPKELVPSMPDYPKYADYYAAGGRYLLEWKLGYTAVFDTYCRGVDAKTGETIFPTSSWSSAISYSDVTEDTHPQAMTLARLGIGYREGTLQPGKVLTQRDLLVLLLSANGMYYEEDTDSLYEAAYSHGMLTRSERAPDQLVSRAQLVKILIDGTGYGKTAGLTGIYRTSFTDDAAIPSQYYGYVATAQGMGLIRGDERGRFNPNETATRGQAVIVLYNFMAR